MGYFFLIFLNAYCHAFESFHVALNMLLFMRGENTAWLQFLHSSPWAHFTKGHDA